MSKRRVLITFLLLPLFTLLESLAWYGSRSVMFMFQIEDVDWGGLGMEGSEAAASFATTNLLLPFVVLFAGALAAGTGPWGLLALGSLLAVPCLAVLGFPAPWLAGAAGLGVVVGHGLIRPGLMSTAAATLRDRSNLRTALVALVYTALNLGAVTSSTGAGKLQQALGVRPECLASAGVMAGAALGALALVGVVLWTRQEAATHRARHLPQGPVLLGSLGLAVLVFLPWMGAMQSWELAWRVFDITALPLWLEPLWISINPLFCCLTGLSVALLAGGLHLAGRSVPDLFFVAAGVLLLSLGTMGLLVAGLLGSAWLALGGLALAAVGEATMMSFFISRMLGDLHWRAVAPVLALWLAVNDGGYALISWIREAWMLDWLPPALGWTGVATGLLSALVLAAAALPAQRRLWSPRA